MAGWEDFPNSFSGNIDNIPYISVDNFYDKTKKAYFLSHFHVDHTGGLRGYHASELKKEGATIYMSITTAVIFRHTYGGLDYGILEGQIITLATDTAHVLDINGTKLQVTLVPVDHMPGAVMFLFKVVFGDNGNQIRTILYTGDFVITNDNLQEAYPSLHDRDRTPIHIDEMYCDNTHRNMFGWPLVDLPSRSTVLTDATELIQEWLEKNDNNTVAIYTFYDYAYEELFKAISTATGHRIALSDATRLNVYREIFNDQEEMYTGDQSKIHVYNEINPGDKDKQPNMNVMRIHVRLYNRPEALVCDSDGPNPEYSLNYPTHCSRRQLDEFVEYFNTEKQLKVIKYFAKHARV